MGRQEVETTFFSVPPKKKTDPAAIYTLTGADSRLSNLAPVRLLSRNPSAVFPTTAAHRKKYGRSADSLPTAHFDAPTRTFLRQNGASIVPAGIRNAEPKLLL